MTDTIEPVLLDEDEKQALAQRLVDQAKVEGVDLIGPGGVLSGLTKQVLETALEEEMAEHLGYDKHDQAGRNRGNSRNGSTPKTIATDIGKVTVDVAAGSGWVVRAADRAQASAPAGGVRRGRDLAVCQGHDDR